MMMMMVVVAPVVLIMPFFGPLVFKTPTLNSCRDRSAVWPRAGNKRMAVNKIWLRSDLDELRLKIGNTN